MGLAGQYKSVGHFVFFHLTLPFPPPFSFYAPGPAGATDPSFASEGQVGSLLQGGIQDRLPVVRQVEVIADPVQLNGDLAGLAFQGGFFFASFLPPALPFSRQIVCPFLYTIA